MARSLALWALLSTLVLTTLGANPWTVEVIALSEEANGLLDLVHQKAEEYAHTFVADQNRLTYLNKKSEKMVSEEWETEVARQWASHTLPPPNVDNGQKFETPHLIEYTKTPYHKELADLLLFSEEALGWYRMRQDYDALILVDVQPLDRFERIIIRTFETTATGLMDRLVEERSYHQIEEDLASALLGWAGAGTLSALVLEGGPAALMASLDGESVDHKAAIITVAGVHQLALEGPSHVGRLREISLLPAQITLVDGALESLANPPLSIFSNSGEVAWFVQGVNAGSSIQLELNEPAYPLSILATKQGFADQMINLQSPPNKVLQVSMIGSPSIAAPLLERQQRAFYKQLRNTILFFGAHVATVALSKTLGLESQVWQAAQVATSAAALVSAIALGGEMASYGQAYGL